MFLKSEQRGFQFSKEKGVRELTMEGESKMCMDVLRKEAKSKLGNVFHPRGYYVAPASCMYV